jgi:serine/threonine protein kinase
VALEEKQIFHQDLKLENIIRREADGVIYLIDFGQGLTPGTFNRAHHGDIMVNGANAMDAM